MKYVYGLLGIVLFLFALINFTYHRFTRFNLWEEHKPRWIMKSPNPCKVNIENNEITELTASYENLVPITPENAMRLTIIDIWDTQRRLSSPMINHTGELIVGKYGNQILILDLTTKEIREVEPPPDYIIRTTQFFFDSKNEIVQFHESHKQYLVTNDGNVIPVQVDVGRYSTEITVQSNGECTLLKLDTEPTGILTDVGRIHLWNIEQQRNFSLETWGSVADFDIDSTGTYFTYINDGDNDSFGPAHIGIWDFEDETHTTIYRDGYAFGNLIAISPEGQLMVSHSGGQSHIWDVSQKSIIKPLPTGQVELIQFVPDKHLLITMLSSGLIQYWGVVNEN